MAQDIVGSLFGVSANDLQAQRQAAAQAQAMRYAQMNPAEQVNYGGYMAGNQVGNALMGMMGAKDPELEKANMVNSLVKETDMTDLDSVKGLAQKLTQAGATREAMALLPRIDALTKQTEDRTARTEDKQAAIEARREEIRLRGEQRLEELRLKAQADLERAREQNASREQIAAMMAEARRQAAQIAADTRLQMGQLAAAMKAGDKEDKPIPASTLKMYTEAGEKSKQFANDEAKAEDFIQKIDQGVVDFSASENLIFSPARALTGTSNESDRTKADIRRYTTGAVNAILNMAKGPQTDQDAQRAKEQIMSGLDKNDKNLVADGLRTLKKYMAEGRTIADQTREEVGDLGGINKKKAKQAPTQPQKRVSWNDLK